MLEKSKIHWKILLIYILISALMLCAVARLFVINNSDYKAVWQSQNTIKIKIATSRGSIFDCKLSRITNASKKTVAIVSPTPRAITVISNYLEGEALIATLQKLRKGEPVVVQVEGDISCDGIICKEVYDYSTSDISAPQLIGYLDSEGHGACGIEAAYDELLYSGDDIYAYFAIDANNKLLEGVEPQISEADYIQNSGIALTIDSNIQKITAQGMLGH